MLTQFRRGNNLHVFCELERGKGEMGELLGNVVGGKYVALGVFRGQFRPPTVAMLCWLAAAFYLTPHCPPLIPPAPVIIPPYLLPISLCKNKYCSNNAYNNCSMLTSEIELTTDTISECIPCSLISLFTDLRA